MSHPLSEKKQREILQLLAEMGGQVEAELSVALDALARRNDDAMERTLVADRKVDQIDRRINEICLDYAAHYQPSEQDLRGIFAFMKISLYLERIGDYAKNIAARSESLDYARMTSLISSLQRMGQLTLKSLSKVLNAAMDRDIKLAQKVWKADADIDALYNTLFADIMAGMGQRPMDVTNGMHLLFMARNMERIGDHISNIAEMLHYWITGTRFEDTRSVYDNTSSLTQPLISGAESANTNINDNPFAPNLPETQKAS